MTDIQALTTGLLQYYMFSISAEVCGLHLNTSGETWSEGQVWRKGKWNALRTLPLDQTSGSGFATGANHRFINKR